MVTTRSVLNNLTSRSLVLLDEIDGAQAPTTGSASRGRLQSTCTSQDPQPLTLFATHYHELNDMSQRFTDWNVNESRKWGKSPFASFAWRFQPQFWHHVAQLADARRAPPRKCSPR